MRPRKYWKGAVLTKERFKSTIEGLAIAAQFYSERYGALDGRRNTYKKDGKNKNS